MLARAEEPAAQPDDELTNDEAQAVLRCSPASREAIQAQADNEPSAVTRATLRWPRPSTNSIMIIDPPASLAQWPAVELTRAVRDVIRLGLYLIGVEAPGRCKGDHMRFTKCTALAMTTFLSIA